MDRFYLRNKLSPETSVSDNQHSPKKKSNRNQLIGQSSHAPKETSTALSEYRTPHTDEAETSHRKDTEHDIPQWRIGLKERHTFYLPQEAKKLVSKINNELAEFQKDLQTYNFSREVLAQVTKQVNSIQREATEDLAQYAWSYLTFRTGLDKPTRERKISTYQNKAGELLNATLNNIYEVRQALSGLNKSPEIIEKLQNNLETISHQGNLKNLIHTCLTDEIQQIKNPSADTKLTRWKHLSWEKEDIETIEFLINAHNDKKSQPRKTRLRSAHNLLCSKVVKKLWQNCHRKNNEPPHLKLWLEKLVPNIQESNEWT